MAIRNAKAALTVERIGCGENCEASLTMRVTDSSQGGIADKEGLANYHFRGTSVGTQSPLMVVIACTGVAELSIR